MKTRNPKSEIRKGIAACLMAFSAAVSSASAQQVSPGTANLPIGSAEAAHPPTPTPPDTLRQTATRQEQIRAEAKLLVSRLDEVIAEYTRNGLAKGEDFEALKDVRGQLGSLSDEEMEEVIDLLKQSAGNPGQMAKAYSGQKDISLRLKQILAAHERQQDIDALASAVRQLADRQSANLGTAIDAGRLAAQDKSADGQAAVTASEQAQQSEEKAIGEEVKLVVAKLSQMDADPKVKDAAAQLEKVPDEAEAASGALGNGRLDDAKTAEESAHGQLAQVAGALAPENAPAPAQSPDMPELAALARDQRAMLTKTAQLTAALAKTAQQQTPDAVAKAMTDAINAPASPIARQLARSGITAASAPDQIQNAPAMKAFLDKRADGLKNQEQALQSQLAALSGTEAALAAKAQMVRDDLQGKVKDAEAPMANAVTQINSAQQALADGDGDQAAQEETDAANQLDKAQQAAAQSGAAEAQAAPPPGADQQLQQLQNGVNQLTARETASVQQGDAMQTGAMGAAAADLQSNLASQAQALQQTAAAAQSPSAPALQAATGAFQNAARSMQAGMPAAATAAQQAALQNLGQAAQQLARQAAAAAQQKQDLAALEKQMASLMQVIRLQQLLNIRTRKVVDEGNAPPRFANQLAREQAGIQSSAAQLRQTADPATPGAAKSLDQAAAAMADAGQKLSDATLKDAEPPEQAALQALYGAQDALATRMREVAQDLGQPVPGAGQATAAANAALARAQAQATAAENAMAPADSGNGAMQKAAVQLGQAAQAAANAAGQPQALPQAATDAIRAAQQALAAAAASAAAGPAQQAQAQAQAAQASQAIAAAQSAMAAAQAGIAQLSPSDQGQGQDQGQDQGQGQDKGQGQGQGQGQDQGQGQGKGQPGPSSSGAGRGATGAAEKSWGDTAGASTAAKQEVRGQAVYLGLPDRDRAAIQQSQAEKYPQEYGSMIEEYMRSLASDAGGK